MRDQMNIKNKSSNQLELYVMNMPCSISRLAKRDQTNKKDKSDNLLLVRDQMNTKIKSSNQLELHVMNLSCPTSRLWDIQDGSFSTLYPFKVFRC